MFNQNIAVTSTRRSGNIRVLLLSAVLLGGLSSTAHAFEVYTERSAWESAVAEASACNNTKIVTDDFADPIAQAQTITFDSGVKSTNSDILGTMEVGVDGAVSGDPVNSVQNSFYINSLDNGTGKDEKSNSTSATWSLLPGTCAIAFDQIYTDLLTSFSDKVGLEGDFDGAGDEFINVSKAIGSYTGFIGVVGNATFSSIKFSVATDANPNAVFATFSIDNALYASRPVYDVPTLSQWGLGILGLMLTVVGGFYFRRQKTPA